ncbi:7 transmembrane receptor [Dictyocaulus viviparus]|uniref:7 transmembrane receptor n=1 Tax=Dictyocaulus viviparus TaxID=29172 RepID=A0A0D8XYX8_DICVI|nr:7 transmembrane receptor [Dictyocaulus viviparus]
MAWTVLIYMQAALGALWNGDPGLSIESDELLTPVPYRLCLGLQDVFIALFLVMMILMTVFGNVLVVLSVVVYKRMRTFTNILLTSLATADLLVGFVVMPMSLLDLLHNHRWPLGKFLCGVWATSDVLLCTASILNLCVISLDRYMAITSPLKYPRTRSRKMAAGLLSSVWILSLIVCSPPWFVPGWGLFTIHNQDSSLNSTNLVNYDEFICGYSPSVPYRIYSALGSFYIPLLVMLSVYFKIFRVASEREAVMCYSTGTCRLSNRLLKSQQNNNRGNFRTSSAPRSCMKVHTNNMYRINYSAQPIEFSKRHDSMIQQDSRSTECDDSPLGSAEIIPKRKSTDINSQVPSMTRRAQAVHARLQPNNLLAKAYEHYQTNGPGKSARGSKEKMVYMRERKALKTIGIVVMGFIICWMPFFVIYLIEVFATTLSTSTTFKLINEFFLWLGYSNSLQMCIVSASNDLLPLSNRGIICFITHPRSDFIIFE